MLWRAFELGVLSSGAKNRHTRFLIIPSIDSVKQPLLHSLSAFPSIISFLLIDLLFSLKVSKK